MRGRVWAIVFASAVACCALLPARAAGESARRSVLRLAPVPRAPSGGGPLSPCLGDRAAAIGRPPYWGQALGATYYNWGYFGARHHAQLWTHRGYDARYRECGHSKGY
ncbi:MAG: hypothetical protein ACUVUC_11430 [Thermoguttaceae bacterium]